MGSPPPFPERACDVARFDTRATPIDHLCATSYETRRPDRPAVGCGYLAIEQAIEQFPSEQTLTNIVASSKSFVARSDAIDLGNALDIFPSEVRLLVSVPAGPPIAYDDPGQHGGHRAAQVVQVHRMRAAIVHAAMAALRVLHRMWLSIRLARHLWAAAWGGAVQTARRLRSAVGALATEAVGVVRSAGGIAIERCRVLRSRAAITARGARDAVGLSVARALELSGRLSIDLIRELRAVRRWIAIRLDAANRLARPRARRERTARMATVWKATGHHSLELGRRALSAAHRAAVPAVVFTGIIATATFAISRWDVLRAVAPVEPKRPALESLPPTIDAVAANAKGRAPSTAPRREPRPIRDPSPPIRVQEPGPVTSTAAIQRVLNRYRDAHSTLDVSAVTAAWPSVDTAALRRSFARLAEHNLEYESCRISAANSRATAVCRGVTQSVRVGDRTTTAESRQWQFVLDRVEDRWLITAVDAR